VTKHLECCGPDLPLQPDGYCACPPGWSRFLDGAACCAPGNIVQNGQCVSLTPSSSQPQMERRCQPDETYRDGRCWPAASAPIIVPPTGVVVPVSPCAPGLVFRNGGCGPAVTAPIVVPSTGVGVRVSPCGLGRIFRGGHCVWPTETITKPQTLRAPPSQWRPPFTVRRSVIPGRGPTLERRSFHWLH
jgi:hypothetical protein